MRKIKGKYIDYMLYAGLVGLALFILFGGALLHSSGAHSHDSAATVHTHVESR